MRINVVSLKPNPPISCVNASQPGVPSSYASESHIAASISRELTEATPKPADLAASVTECRRLASLSAHEILLGAVPSPRHYSTPWGNLRGCDGDPRGIPKVLIDDLRSYLEIGARGFAADQRIVLRLFLAKQLSELRSALRRYLKPG